MRLLALGLWLVVAAAWPIATRAVAEGGARVDATATQSIPASTHTLLTFDTIAWDTDGMFDPAFPTRLSAVTAGWYQIGCGASIATSNSGNRLLRLVHGGATVISYDSETPISGGVWRGTIETAYYLEEGEYVECTVYQSAGGALATSLGESAPEFYAVMLGGTGGGDVPPVDSCTEACLDALARIGDGVDVLTVCLIILGGFLVFLGAWAAVAAVRR